MTNRPSILAFVRVASNPVVFRQPATPAAASRIAREWCRRDNVWIPRPGASHGEILDTLLADAHITSRLVPDTHLAALAIEPGLTLCSTDGDFAMAHTTTSISPARTCCRR